MVSYVSEREPDRKVKADRKVGIDTEEGGVEWAERDGDFQTSKQTIT